MEAGDAESETSVTPVGAHYLLKLGEYTDFGGIRRPARRSLLLTDASGQPIRTLYEQRINGIVWDPPITGEMFERRPNRSPAERHGRVQRPGHAAGATDLAPGTPSGRPAPSPDRRWAASSLRPCPAGIVSGQQRLGIQTLQLGHHEPAIP